MLFNKVVFGLFCLTIILAHPLVRVSRDENGIIDARATKAPTSRPPTANAKAPQRQPPAQPPSKKGTPPKMQLYTGNSFVDQARKANSAPGRQVPKACKNVNDCSCPKASNSNAFHSTSCINGFCSCDNKAVNFLAKTSIEGMAAVGNAPVTKAVGHVMKTMSDATQVIGSVAGIFGPEAKFAVKAALNVIPNMGSSHLDDLTKNAIGRFG